MEAILDSNAVKIRSKKHTKKQIQNINKKRWKSIAQNVKKYCFTAVKQYFRKSRVVPSCCRNESKWSPVTRLKSKEIGFWCSLKFISNSVWFYESKTPSNGDPKKWYLGDFSMLWAQACPKAPQSVHLVYKICVFDYPEVCFHDILFEFKRIINVKFTIF